MDHIALLIALAWLSAAVSFFIAWNGWRRRHLLLAEGAWFILVSLAAGVWTWSYGMTLAARTTDAFWPWVVVRNNAASLTALAFFATVLSAVRPQWRKTLWVFVPLAAAVQWSAEWAAWPYWTAQEMTVAGRRVFVAVLQNPPWHVSLLGTWLPMLWFFLGLALLGYYVRPLLRAIPKPRLLFLGLSFLVLSALQVWTLLPGSPLMLKVVQILPLSMALVSLVLSDALLRLRFGFTGAFTPEGVLGQVREGVVVLTNEGLLAWWNAPAAQALGLTPGDRGLPWQEKLGDHPAWQQQRNGLREVRGEIIAFEDGQGRHRDWLVSWLPLKDEGSLVLGWVFLFDDLTEERDLQRTLHLRLQIQNLLRELFAFLLEDLPLDQLAQRVLATLMQPLGAHRPRQAALYVAAAHAGAFATTGWQRLAWSGDLNPPPEQLFYPPGAAWNEKHFWAVFREAGGQLHEDHTHTLVWPLSLDKRVWGALLLAYPADAAPSTEVCYALHTAAQIVTHLMHHHANRARLLQMQQVYQSMQEPVLIQDIRGRVLDCNPAAEEILGINYEDMVGRMLSETGLVLLEPTPEELAQALRQAPVWRGHLRLTHPRWPHDRLFAVSTVRIHTPFEAPQVRLVSVLRDITEEGRLKQALAQERTYFERLVEVSRVMLSAAATLEQAILHALRVSVELAAAEDGTLVVLDAEGEPQVLYTLEGRQDRRLDLARQVLQRGAAAVALQEKRVLRLDDVHTTDLWLPSPGGDPWRAALVVPLFYQERPLGVLTLTHQQAGHFTAEHERLVSGAAELIALALHNAALYEEQFRLGQALLEAKERAEHLRRRQERFFANLSHEMRTPLQAIIGYVDVLRLEHPDGAEMPDLAAIEQAARELLDLVNQMLDFQRSRLKEDYIHPEPVVLSEVVAAATAVVRPLLQRRRNRLSVRIAPADLDMVTDAEKLRRIVLNLLSNAVKFTEAGEVQVDIAAVEREGQPWVRIQVRDTGIGIPPEEWERIFEPFEQVEGQAAGGTGLGLYLVRTFAQRLGGWVEVESTPGQGSTFTVWLPRHLEETPPPTAPLPPLADEEG